MGDLLQDLRHAVRALARRPAYTVLAVLTMALGIGAATAVWSVVDHVLFDPLPYADSDRLVTVYGTLVDRGAKSLGLSPPDFLDLRDDLSSVGQLEGYIWFGLSLNQDGQPRELTVLQTTPGLLSLLGVKPAYGRTFLPQEAEGDHVVVLSDHLFHRAFGGDPGIVGSKIRLEEEPWTVVGVMPADFGFPTAGVDLWYPVDVKGRTERKWRALNVVGRLGPNVELASAQREADAAALAIAQAYPETNQGAGVRLEPLKDTVVGEVRQALLVVLGAVGLLLLIACANVSNLTLARGIDRQRDLAARVALGASRGQLVRASLAESTVLALLGGLLGVLLAYAGTLFLASLGAGEVPRANEVQLDGRVLAIAGLLVVLAGPLFGLVPALQTTRRQGRGLRGATRGASELVGAARLRRLLIAAEIAMSFLLLVGAGLMVRSWQRVASLDPGFQPDRALAVQLFVYGPQYPGDKETLAFAEQLLTGVRALPGVTAAGVVNALPLSVIQAGASSVQVEGRAEPEREEAAYRVSTPGYLEAIGRRLVSGRDFTTADRADGARVAVLNETAARRYFPGEEALGQRLRFASGKSWATVVGVIADVRQLDLELAAPPELFLPFAQYPSGTMTLLVRTQGDPAGLLKAVEAQVWQVDPIQPIFRALPLADWVSDSLARRRFFTSVLAVFASLAGILAVVGLYGVISYSVAQRRQEIAVRMALGAFPAEIRRMVLWDGAKLALAGLAVGLAASLLLGRALASLLFEVQPTDPLTLTAMSLSLFLVAVASALPPARRAATVAPAEALSE